MSGGGSLEIARALSGNHNFEFVPRHAHFVGLSDPQTSEAIDDAIVTYFKAPNSFTGEDVVEVSCHGSPILLRRVIDICLSLGARMAEPGEFSLRALANGRMNLAEAEAIRDLIDAQTVASARQAVRQMPEAQLAQGTRLYGREVPQWSVLLQLVAHMNEHLGQSIAYARMNGVVPPWSQ